MFEQIEQILKASDIWNTMLSVKEDSPWHRENNVAEHTRMVLNWYTENLASGRDEYCQFLTKTALLFHDTGKPQARTPVEKDGVTHFRYPGHELISARIFENFVVVHNLLETVIDVSDFRRIKWLIENHLPYGITNSKGLTAVKFDLNAQNPAHTVDGTLQRVFLDVLLSDAHGRISDNHAEKLQNVDDWIEKFIAQPVELKERAKINYEKAMILGVGVSGSGKTTGFEKLIYQFTKDDNSYEILSLDIYRHDFFEKENGRPAETYRAAYLFCLANEKEFIKYWQAKSTAAIKNGKDRIIIDNTNLSRRARRFWIHNAHNHGYKVVALEFINSVAELKARQLTRGDKQLRAKDIDTQYFTQSCVGIGREVEELYVIYQPQNVFLKYAETQKAYELVC